jgi:hypothetical protein
MSDFAAIRFLAGRPLTKELGADRLNTILTEIKRNKPKGERGITVRQDGNQTWIGLAASLPRGGGTSATTHPFQVLFRKDPQSEITYVGVRQGYVFSGLIQTTLPTGLLTDPSDPDDQGWQQADALKFVWLEFYDGQFSVEFGDEEDFNPTALPWSEKSVLETDDENENFPVFEKARRLIAEIIEEDEAFSALQFMKGHQTFADVVVNGIPGGYFYEWGGGLPPSEE